MPRGTRLTRLLATAFLSGEWTHQSLKERGNLALRIPKRRRWLDALVKAVLARCPCPPNARQLTRLLGEYWYHRRLWRYEEELDNPSLLHLPRPEMRPVAPLAGYIRPSRTIDDLAADSATDVERSPAGIAGAQRLATSGDLAEWLSLTPGELDWFTDLSLPRNRVAPGPLRHYRYRLLPKRSGGWRLLEIPKPRLKQIQRQILHGILDWIPPHPAAHAYRSGHSVASYVAPHAGQKVILHIDLCDFFPTIRTSQVHALFHAIGYPTPVARNLTSLCTHCAGRDAFVTEQGTLLESDLQLIYRERHVPQGAPTSPAIANLCAWWLDLRLTALSAKFGATYTRYADDLLFSGGADLLQGVDRFRQLVLEIALDEGFQIRVRKTRVKLRSQSQRVAGITINEHPNLRRQDFDQLKALLFNCVRHGPASQNRENRANFAQHLQGRVAYLSMINPHRGAKLKVLFDQIHWADT